jgi:hypothetical protein
MTNPFSFDTIENARAYLEGLKDDGCTGSVRITIMHDGHSCPIHEASPKKTESSRPWFWNPYFDG